MNASQTQASDLPDAGGRFLLWFSLWGGGIAWAMHLFVVWIIAEFGCIGGLARPGPLQVSWVVWAVVAASLVFIGLAGLAIGGSLLCRRKLAGEDARFVARFGLAANPLFLLIIIAQALPVFFYLQDCGSYLVP
jgi:hypothetical protein